MAMAKKTRNDWRAEHLVELYTEQLGGLENVRRGCEVGVWKGELSWRLLKALPHTILHLVDPYQVYDDKYIGTEQERIDRARELALAAVRPYEEQAIWIPMESSLAVETIEDGSLDFVFIDACHSYEFVRQDIRAWYPKVRAGGIVSGHDYNGRGDRRGVFGVKRAVDEWAAEIGIDIHVAPQLVWWTKKEEQ